MRSATHTYYRTTYLGELIPEAQFPRLSARALAYIDRITFGRLAASSTLPDAAKQAQCAVADVLYRAEQDGGVITAESSGSYSRSLGTQPGESVGRRMHDAAVLYLAGTGLLYRG